MLDCIHDVKVMTNVNFTENSELRIFNIWYLGLKDQSRGVVVILVCSHFVTQYFSTQEIGRGSYSVCRKCVHKASGGEYAVKVGIFFSVIFLGTVQASTTKLTNHLGQCKGVLVLREFLMRSEWESLRIAWLYLYFVYSH